MLPKHHLTSHSKRSGSRWVIIPSWLSGSWRSFLHSSSVYSCHLFLISSASVRFITFLTSAWNNLLISLIFLKRFLLLLLLLSLFSCVQLWVTSWTAAYHSFLSMTLFMQEYWSGVPLPSLEEISSFSHSIVFLCFFALIMEECFLISPCYSLELCIQMGISFLFSFAFHSLLFTAICEASSDSHFAFCISFSWGWSSSLSPVQCHEPLSIVLQASYQI